MHEFQWSKLLYNTVSFFISVNLISDCISSYIYPFLSFFISINIALQSRVTESREIITDSLRTLCNKLSMSEIVQSF